MDSRHKLTFNGAELLNAGSTILKGSIINSETTIHISLCFASVFLPAGSNSGATFGSMRLLDFRWDSS